MRDPVTRDPISRDQGSVLVIAVVLVAVAGAGVTGLAAHTGAVERSSTAARAQFLLDTTADSAVARSAPGS